MPIGIRPINDFAFKKTFGSPENIAEDKKMYDAREKAIRDQKWALNASFRDGEAKGKK